MIEIKQYRKISAYCITYEYKSVVLHKSGRQETYRVHTLLYYYRFIARDCRLRYAATVVWAGVPLHYHINIQSTSISFLLVSKLPHKKLIPVWLDDKNFRILFLSMFKSQNTQA